MLRYVKVWYPGYILLYCFWKSIQWQGGLDENSLLDFTQKIHEYSILATLLFLEEWILLHYPPKKTSNFVALPFWVSALHMTSTWCWCPKILTESYSVFCDISFRLSCLAINDCSLKLTLWISMLGMNFDARNVPILMLEMNFSAYNLEFRCLQSTLSS